MRALIQQHGGLGDIIFAAKLVDDIRNEGYEITWPVLPYFLEGCQRAYPFFRFVDWTRLKINYANKADTVIDYYRYIPIRWSYEILNVHFNNCMRSKYDLYKKDWTHWRTLPPVRDLQRESDLKKKVGAIGEYTLVNKRFKSSQVGKVKINVHGIVMEDIPGFSLFDWMGVIEDAAEIHTVSTSICYLMELVELKCNPYIYLRKPDECNHDNYNYLMTRHNYNFMGTDTKVEVVKIYQDLVLRKKFYPGETMLVDKDRAEYLVNKGKVRIIEQEKKEPAEKKKREYKKAEK